MRLWPKSLYWQIVLILAVGMFTGQILTGSIWFETHDNRATEIPARLFASRLADMVRLFEKTPERAARERLAALLQDERFKIDFIPPPPVTAAPSDVSIAQQSIQDLLAGVIARRLQQRISVRLLHVSLQGDAGTRHGIWALFDSRAPSAAFTVQLALPNGEWVQVDAQEGQAGMQTEPSHLLFDYFARLYFLRFAAVFLLSLLAVRLALAPLKTLAAAAERLGRNIHHAPLDARGPSEVRRAAESLNAMQRQLIASLGERTRMLGMISHDLRTPITKLRLRAEMLRDAAERERFHADLVEMESMLRDAIDFVRGVDVSEPLREVDMQSLIFALAEDFRELGGDVAVHGTVSRLLPGYASNLRRCLQNVLENAVRFGSHVVIDVADSAAALRITVYDDGPGIADPVRLAALNEGVAPSNLGDRPSVVHGSRGAPVAHAGLGLLIVRSVMAAHGGTLRVGNRIDPHIAPDPRITGFEVQLSFPRK